MGLKEWIIPQDKVFFDMFERHSAVLLQATRDLVDLIGHFEDVRKKVQRIKDLEHEGDKITHEIYEQLNVTFITPLEPHEISGLASAMDDILDYIDGSARKMENYGITETDAPMREFAQLLCMSVSELDEAIKQIRHLKDPREVERRCIEVHRVENLADEVLAHAVRDLFKSGDPITILKMKDIYEYLELATDKCEDAANVLSDIGIRHS